MKRTLLLPIILVTALGQMALPAVAKSVTYTRANLADDHFLWEYYPPDASYDDLVFDSNGCFFFIYDNAAHPVADSEDKQLCRDSYGNFGEYAAPSPRF